LSEIGAVSATVDSTETGAYNPDVIAITAVLPSSEHIPVTRAASITSFGRSGSGGFDFLATAASSAGRRPYSTYWLTMEDMQIKRSVAMVLNWPQIQTRTFDFATFSRKRSLTPTPS
jgi:hypothetical protein